MITLRSLHKIATPFVAAASAMLALSVATGCAGHGAALSPTSTMSARQVTRTDGFMRHWLILEPIRANGLTDSAVQAAVNTDYFPNQFTVIPHPGDKVTVAGEELTWHAVDTDAYNVNLYYFAYDLGKPTSNVLFWVVTIIDCPHEMRDVRLAIGSNAASVWWVNGQEVIGIYNDRQTVIDDGVSKRLTLKQGPNVVRGAIINAGGHTDFCARFLDAREEPLKDLTVRVGDGGK